MQNPIADDGQRFGLQQTPGVERLQQNHARKPGFVAQELAQVERGVKQLVVQEAARMVGEVLRRTHDGGYPTFWPDDPERWLTPHGLIGAWVSASAREDSTVIGHVALTEVKRDAADYATWGRVLGTDVSAASLTRLFVDPDQRGRGTGRALVSRAVASARASGHLPVLDVVDSDVSAIRLYEATGWHRVATTTWPEGGDQRSRHLYVHVEPGPVHPGRPAC